MDYHWVVNLEAAGLRGGSDLAEGVLEQLKEVLADFGAVAEGYDHRYVVRLHVEAGTEAEALFVAVARWKIMVRLLPVPTWPLTRCEVFPAIESDSESPDPDLAAVCKTEPEAVAGDDLFRRAMHDSLTGLVNREVFADQVRSALVDEGDTGASWAVLVVDVDHFAAVNRSAGTLAGDRLLVVLASRVTAAFVDAVVGSLGSDSMALLVRHIDAISTEATADRLLDAIRAPFDIDGHRFAITASVGVSISGPMSHPDDLLRRAATAMCVAKSDGGDCARFYDPLVRVDASRLDSDVDSSPDRLAYALLLERTATTSNECGDLEAVAAVVLGEVCAHTGWPLGHLSVISADGARIEPTATWHVRGVDHFARFRALIGQWSQPSGEDLAGRVLRTGEMAWAADLWSPDRLPCAAEAARSGITAGFAFPVLVGAEVVAVLEFYSTGSGTLDASLAEAMAGVGVSLGRVVERSRAQAALARNEERYRSWADSVPVLMWMSGVDGKRTLVNKAWLDFSGRAMAIELGDGWAQGVHPDDLLSCMTAYRQAFAHREPFEMDYRLRRADGQYRWVHDTGNPVGTGDNFQGFVGGCIDVSDRRNTETGGDSETRFRALVEASRTMIILLARDGTIIAEYLGHCGFGYPEGSTTGDLGFGFVHPDDLGRAAAAFAEAISKPGLTERFECRVRHADGSWRWVEAVGNNLLDDPNVQSIVVTAHELGDQSLRQPTHADNTENRPTAKTVTIRPRPRRRPRRSGTNR